MDTSTLKSLSEAIASLTRFISEAEEEENQRRQEAQRLKRDVKELLADFGRLKERNSQLDREAEDVVQVAKETPKTGDPNLNPSRAVTNVECTSFWAEARRVLSHADTATLVVQARVAEALRGTIPKSEYDAAVRELAAESYLSEEKAAAGYISPRYAVLCKRFGVDPIGVNK